MKISRKSFLKALGTSALSVAALPALSNQNQRLENKPLHKHQLKLGLASYSLRKFTLDQVIEMTKRVGLPHIALKSMHMPLDSNPSIIRATAAKIRQAGLDLYGAGVIYMKSEMEVHGAFAYAQAADLKVIIGVPNPDLLPLVEKKVKETDIKVAIHNHGPGDKVYPSPQSVYDKVKNLDKRIGLCIDIGHTKRIELDPAADALKYADRLHDIHLKDVNKIGAEGSNIELGHGIIDIPAFLRTLNKMAYEGIVSFEFEKDGDDPLPGLAESVGYARGVLDVI